MGAEFLPGADACTVCGTECSWTDPRLKSLLVCVLLTILVVLRVRTSVGGEEKRSLWSTGADLRFIYDTGHMTVSIPSRDGIISAASTTVEQVSPVPHRHAQAQNAFVQVLAALFHLSSLTSLVRCSAPRTMKRSGFGTLGALGPSHHGDLSTDPLLHLFPRHLTTLIQFLCTAR